MQTKRKAVVSVDSMLHMSQPCDAPLVTCSQSRESSSPAGETTWKGRVPFSEAIPYEKVKHVQRKAARIVGEGEPHHMGNS